MESHTGAGGGAVRGAQAGVAADMGRDVSQGERLSLAVFDREDFTRRMGHNRELCGRILRVFMQETPRQLERLNQAIAVGDVSTVQYVAHGIKGAAASVSAHVVHQKALDVETAARAADIKGAHDKLLELEWAFASFLEVLSRDSL